MGASLKSSDHTPHRLACVQAGPHRLACDQAGPHWLACVQAGIDGLPQASLRHLQSLASAQGLDAKALADAGFLPEHVDAILALIADQPRLERLAKDISTALSGGALLPVQGALAEAFKDLKNPPLFLAANSTFHVEDLSLPRVALVGTRQASERALRWTRALAAELTEAGVLIISGGAFGIDQAAHEGALQAGGKTLAVMGGNFVAEREHLKTAFSTLWQQGQVISEQFRPGSVQAWMYPRRNRLVAALAQVVVVIEGRKKSGALITAKQALGLKRQVLAVPGWVEDPMAQAPNSLLGDGAAKVCLGSDQVLQSLALLGAIKAPGQGPVSSKSRRKNPPSHDDEAQGRLFAQTKKPAPTRQGSTHDIELSAVQKQASNSKKIKSVAPAGGPKNASAKKPLPLLDGLSNRGRQLLTWLWPQDQAQHIDKIAEGLRWSPQDLASVLLEVELAGLIEQLPGACYRCRK